MDCPENLFVMTDPIRLKQVILNLVRNSSRFVGHGFIRMRADVVDNSQVQLYVEDSGPGISPAQEIALFSKYQGSRDLLNQGTGLGLNLSQKLMQTMGGELRLDCSYNSGVEGRRGARFVVQLNASPLDVELPATTDCESDPSNDIVADQNRSDGVMEPRRLSSRVPAVASEEMAVVDEEARPVAPPNHPDQPLELTVLFVDDDPVVRKLFVRAVAKAQPTWTIQEACSGAAALKLCEEALHKPDLIFMDQYMATVDKPLLGTETVHAMRSKGIQSIICGLSANDIRESFIAAGADEFVLKPIPCNVDELRLLFRRILGTRQVSNEMIV